jgi:cytochrome P450
MHCLHRGLQAPINKMCDPHGQPNLLTAAADERWKAIRKAVAVSFSAQNIKKKFPMILDRVNEVVRRWVGRGEAQQSAVPSTPAKSFLAANFKASLP